MLLSSESRDPVISPFNDVHERVRQFNDDEAVWRCFEKKRALRKGTTRASSLTERRIRAHREDELDRLDWLAAEREVKSIRAIGIWISA